MSDFITTTSVALDVKEVTDVIKSWELERIADTAYRSHHRIVKLWLATVAKWEEYCDHVVRTPVGDCGVVLVRKEIGGVGSSIASLLPHTNPQKNVVHTNLTNGIDDALLKMTHGLVRQRQSGAYKKEALLIFGRMLSDLQDDNYDLVKQLIANDPFVHPYLHNPTDELTRLHEMKHVI